MAVQIDLSKIKKPEQPMARRLFGMAAPIVGSIYGGPAGAAAGSMLGNSVMGGSAEDSVMKGVQAYGGAVATGGGQAPAAGAPAADPMADMPKLEQPQLGDSAFGRRHAAISQDPQVALQEGLNTLSVLPKDHPMRKQYTEPLVRASYLAGRK
jgi:hypothetical protein